MSGRRRSLDTGRQRGSGRFGGSGLAIQRGCPGHRMKASRTAASIKARSRLIVASSGIGHRFQLQTQPKPPPALQQGDGDHAERPRRHPQRRGQGGALGQARRTLRKTGNRAAAGCRSGGAVYGTMNGHRGLHHCGRSQFRPDGPSIRRPFAISGNRFDGRDSPAGSPRAVEKPYGTNYTTSGPGRDDSPTIARVAFRMVGWNREVSRREHLSVRAEGSRNVDVSLVDVTSYHKKGVRSDVCPVIF